MLKNESSNLNKLYYVADQISKNKDYSLESIKREINSDVENQVLDIFLINKNFVVFDTTYAPDMNLDFKNMPIALATVKDVYSGQKKFDISKTILTFKVNNNFALKKYFLIKPKELDFMVQIGIEYDSFESKKIDSQIKKIMPNIINYDMYTFFKKGTLKNITGTARLLSSEEFKFLKQGDSKNDYYKKFGLDSINPDFKKIYEDAVGQKYSTDNSLVYKNLIQTLEKNKNVIILNGKNKKTSTILIPVNFYKEYLDKYLNEVIFFTMTIDNSEFIREVNNFKIINIGYLSLFLLIFIIVGLVVYNKILTPLIEMKSLMNERKKIDKSLIDKSKNELGDVMLAYNELFDKLEKESFINKTLLENLKTFASNSIHQLKTPMSVINIYLGMIKDSLVSNEIKDNINSSIIMMNHIQNTLAYKIQKDYVDFPAENINISEILRRQIELFSVISKSYNKEIIYDIEESCVCFINKVEFEHLIDNNLSNGIKYGNPEKSIFVSLKYVNNDVVLIFSNEGMEIQNKHIIFDRFVRQSTINDGQGIGLNLVKDICDKYNIKVQLDYENNQNKFIYILPNELLVRFD
jgi:signal transduction histidine kinase